MLQASRRKTAARVAFPGRLGRWRFQAPGGF